MSCTSYAYKLFVVSDGSYSINLGGLQADLKGGLGGQSPQESQSEGGESPEQEIWSLCVFACWWLWGVAVVGSSPLSPSAS